ncbi:MAG: nitroreductase family protein [Suipraeoptans sp.]
MLDAIENRRSVRKYKKNTPVENEKLEEVLEAGRLAPSGHNRQPWNFIVIKDDEMKKALAFVDHEQYWMTDAPILIACVGDAAEWIGGESIYVNEEAGFMGLKRVIRDTSIAITQMMLEAENQGLNTCWTGWYQQHDVRPLLEIPEDKYVVGILVVGYGDEKPKQRARKPLADIVKYEKWS